MKLDCSKCIGGSLANTIGTINPFRYRGYYYDTETGLYYLQSRYYDANTGRFLNADGQVNDGLIGTNMFVYCGNNPVNMVDSDGHFAWALALIPAFSNPITAIIAVVAIVAVIVITYVAVSHAVHDYNVSHIKYSSESNVERKGKSNNSSKVKSRNKPKATGIPNSTRIHRGKGGKIDKYTTYDKYGNIQKEVRLTGKPHGDIARPNVKEPDYNINPATGERFKNGYKVRKAENWEIPKGIKWDGN
jgi:RHS repeat-associated protein